MDACKSDEKRTILIVVVGGMHYNLNSQVSWLRRDEAGSLKLLTYGLVTYSSEARGSPAFVKPNIWELRLSSVSPQDAGAYQCQTSTHPPRILNFTLNVIGMFTFPFVIDTLPHVHVTNTNPQKFSTFIVACILDSRSLFRVYRFSFLSTKTFKLLSEICKSIRKI